MPLPFTTRTDIVARQSLDGLAARHRAYANNLANIETPGFQPGDVPFEHQLTEMRDTMALLPATIDQIGTISLDVVADPQDQGRSDGNAVQADRQMVRLAENTLTYEALSQATSMRGELLRSVLTDGRR